jgi:hypothetical protein
MYGIMLTSPSQAKDGSDTLLLALLNNSLELYKVPARDVDSTEQPQVSKVSVVDLHGHR